MRDERRLDGRELLAAREPFDGSDGPPDRVESEHGAGRHRLLAEHHRAGAARAPVAADLRAGEPQLVAQHAGERRARFDAEAAALAVDVQIDFDRAGPQLLRLPWRRARRRRQERCRAGEDAGSLDEPAPCDLQLVVGHGTSATVPGA